MLKTSKVWETSQFTKDRPPKLGDLVNYWFGGNKNNNATVIGVRRYDGKFAESFNWFVKLTAPNTGQGWMEVAM